METVAVTVTGTVGVDVDADAHAHADQSGIAADVVHASATVTGSIVAEGVTTSASATVYAKIGTEVKGHIEAGTHGVAAGAEASIGNTVGVNGDVTVSTRYGSETVGAGVSIGDHFEAGGSAEATYRDGAVTVGVSGDIAAYVGLDVDVSASVNSTPIEKCVTKAADEVVKTATATTHAVGTAFESAGKSIGKGATHVFKKLKLKL